VSGPGLWRVDNRLVHGQVVAGWLPSLGADTVVVLDDEAARNPLVQGVMALAMPPDVTLVVEPVSHAGKLGAAGTSDRSIVLVRDVADAVRALDAGLVADALNLGNVHHAHDRRPVTNVLHLSAAEVGALKSLQDKGIVIEHRAVPQQSPMSLPEISARFDGAVQA